MTGRVCIACGDESATDAAAACPGCGGLLIARQALSRTAVGRVDLERAPAEPEEVARVSADPDRQFDQYVVLEELGRGATGSVYRAWDRDQSRFVALKVLKADDRESEARFVREAQACARLSHPNIVKVHRSGASGGRRFIAMELVRGRTLAQMIAAGGFRRELVVVLRTVCEAVQHAHARGVVHRDLKPENVLVDGEGHPFVVDFGIARPAEPGWTVTLVNEAVGTPSYMSPEQIAGGEAALAPSTDVWALGAILYHVLTGRPPFTGATAYETMQRVKEEEPPRPRLLNPSAPAELEAVCLACLVKDPSRRTAGAGDAAADLARWLSGEPVRARARGAAAQVARWAFARRAVLVSTVLAFAAAGVLVAWIVADRKRAARDDVVRRVDNLRPAIEEATRRLYDPSSDHASIVRQAAEAREAIEAQLRAAPDLAAGHELVGRSWEIAGDWTRAEASWRAAARLDPRLASARYRLGRLLLTKAYVVRLGGASDPEAEEIVREADAELRAGAAPGAGFDAPLHARLVEAMLAYVRRENETVLRLAREAAADFRGRPGVEEFLWLLALVTRGEECDRALEEALRLRPSFAVAHFLQGWWFAERKEWAKAIASYDRAVLYAPRFASAFQLRGAARQQARDLDGAIADCERALELTPQANGAHLRRAMCLADKGEHAAAIAAYDAYLKARPEAIAYASRGWARFRSGDAEGALRDLDEAVARDDRLALAWMYRGHVRNERKDVDAAIADYAKALELRPDASIHANRGALREGRGDAAGAMADYDAAIRLRPDYAFALRLRGGLRRAGGDLDGAVDDLTRAIALDAKDAWALHQRGLIFESQGKIDAAADDFGEAIRRSPDDAHAWANRGKVRAAQGRAEEAAADLRKALEIAPADWPRRSAVERMLEEIRR